MLTTIRWNKLLPVLLTIGAIGIVLNLLPLVILQFTPTAGRAGLIRADHAQQVQQAGGIWCVQLDASGQVQQVLYGETQCEQSQQSDRPPHTSTATPEQSLK